MAPAKWTEIEASEAYQQAPLEVRQGLAERYFDKVVSQSDAYKEATPEVQAALRERLMFQSRRYCATSRAASRATATDTTRATS